jgi:hypothetical protein
MCKQFSGWVRREGEEGGKRASTPAITVLNNKGRKMKNHANNALIVILQA